jgi:hypothetical protein
MEGLDCICVQSLSCAWVMLPFLHILSHGRQNASPVCLICWNDTCSRSHSRKGAIPSAIANLVYPGSAIGKPLILYVSLYCKINFVYLPSTSFSTSDFFQNDSSAPISTSSHVDFFFSSDIHVTDAWSLTYYSVSHNLIDFC